MRWTGSDNLVVVWNLDESSPQVVIDCHPDLVYSACWNWEGSKLLTTCKDKKIRIIDPRSGDVEEEAICHEGSKATRAIYLRNGLVFTTGFSKMSERQYSLRAPSHLNDPIVMVELDTSNGVMFPLYDADTNMVYLCGKVGGRNPSPRRNPPPTMSSGSTADAFLLLFSLSMACTPTIGRLGDPLLRSDARAAVRALHQQVPDVGPAARYLHDAETRL